MGDRSADGETPHGRTTATPAVIAVADPTGGLATAAHPGNTLDADLPVEWKDLVENVLDEDTLPDSVHATYANELLQRGTGYVEVCLAIFEASVETVEGMKMVARQAARASSSSAAGDSSSSSSSSSSSAAAGAIAPVTLDAKAVYAGTQRALSKNATFVAFRAAAEKTWHVPRGAAKKKFDAFVIHELKIYLSDPAIKEVRKG